MIPITQICVEIIVNGVNPQFQSCFTLTGADDFLNETTNIGMKSQSYVGFYPVGEDVNDLLCMINYFEGRADLIKTSMTVDYFDRVSIISYHEDGGVDEVTEVMVDNAKPLQHKGTAHDIFWRHIEHIPSPKGVKHEVYFGEYYLEVYDPSCLEEINIYRKYDYSSLEFTWVWKKGEIPPGEYGLKMRLHSK